MEEVSFCQKLKNITEVNRRLKLENLLDFWRASIQNACINNAKEGYSSLKIDINNYEKDFLNFEIFVKLLMEKDEFRYFKYKILDTYSIEISWS
jgi:hypothetical protein